MFNDPISTVKFVQYLVYSEVYHEMDINLERSDLAVFQSVYTQNLLVESK
jgi:hypothetical protein